MNRAFPILLLACLTACGPRLTRPAGLSLPPLPASVADACGEAPAIADNSIAALIRADAELARLYNICRARHAAAVEAYERARRGVAPPQ